MSFTLKNTGRASGEEVPQVYVGASPGVTASQVVRKLVGYEKLYLKAGESRTVKITVDHDQLTYWNTTTDSYDLGTGARSIWVGRSSADLPLHTTATVSHR